MEKILSIISDKWSDLSDEEKDELISAFSVPTTTHYVDKSRMVILKEDIEKISRTDADLVIRWDCVIIQLLSQMEKMSI